MFRKFRAPRLLSRIISNPPIISINQRHFSVSSVHTTFPATIHRLQTQRLSSLYDQVNRKEGFGNNYLHIAKDGLIYPILSGSLPYSNGAVFGPNSISLQVLLRNEFEIYHEGLEEGGTLADLYVISIPGKCALPYIKFDSILRYRHVVFSLQLSYPLHNNEFNKILDKFYTASATFTDAVEWMEVNEFHKAFPDSNSENWMRE
ncbi:hypothetical protein BO94DRAFT_519528 [Aspergillus sclerotioniger CBS 115572]|uniref:Tse2 ADP-ribosyltransferase toxin domain-containing protein n=1 Tax=Aspergillus sclerotioniger CBS 115572 TaxID=1450535 RepID=A0A317WBM8_9EURO|nr:hypothetical protein BO94DRAFT_519528 [Aspergillus sclerotioniger CBS 115572]PWY83916.1 hypothetical protein BO94DRAFT_519528 [Aspergillus sclerotioniger CBS 115572]